MKIHTSRFGEIEIDEALLFTFVEPILGYDKIERYVLIDNSPESPFKWLQAIEDPNIAFPVTFPAYFGLDYQYVIPEEKAKKLELADPENMLSFNIVSIPQGKPEESTVNLAGPIVINIENKKGLQLVLADGKYNIRHKLFDDAAVKKDEEKSKI